MANQITDRQLQEISIVADQRGNDKLFRLCSLAHQGNKAARQAVANAYALSNQSRGARK
jgi:hypothetical protein